MNQASTIEATRVRLPVVDSNERPDICGPCPAHCCNRWPGIPHPDDLGAPDVDALRANIAAMLATGRWAVDHDAESWLDREPYAWYLRPALRGSEGEQPPWDRFQGSAPCTFLDGGRCSIYETRPRGCRLVVPQPGYGCRSTTSKIDCVEWWKPYEALLLELRP